MNKPNLFIKKRVNILLLLLALLPLLGMFTLNAQTAQVGDYRSNATTMNWTTASSWQICTAAGNPGTWTTATSYPGQNATVSKVTIISGNQVTLNTNVTNKIDTLIVTGTSSTTFGQLIIVSNNYSLNVGTILLTNYGQISYTGGYTLTLSDNASLVINNGGNFATGKPCNNNVRINIGTVSFAACTGGGNVDFTFDQLNQGFGTLTATPAVTPSTICKNGSISLSGGYKGFTGGYTVSYSWTGTGPNGYTFSSTVQNPGTQTLTNSGIYTYSLNVKFTSASGTTYSNTQKVIVTVNEPSTAPTTLTASPATVCSGSASTLTVSGGTMGTSAVYQWSKDNFATILQESAGTTYTTPALTSTTTYQVRRKDPAPCSTVTNSINVTVTVNTPSTAPTSITGKLAVCAGSPSTTLTAAGGTEGTNATYEWGTGSTVGNNIISGATGASYTTPNLTSNTTYWVRRVDKSPCSTTPTAGATATVVITTNEWVGTNGTNWGDLNNWTCNVPANGADVIFAASAQNNLILDADRTIGNLTNNTGKQLIIPTGKALTVNGTVNTGTDPSRILIQSGANVANGSLIFTQPASNQNVYATVEMYSKAFKGALTTWTDNGKKYSTTYRWQYFGIPVAAATNTGSISASSLARYDETKDLDIYYQKWHMLAYGEALTPSTGYAITQDVARTVTFTGKLVAAQQTLTLTSSKSSTPNSINYGSGENLFSNPFTAAIDIGSIQFPTDFADKTIYIFNTGTFSDWGNALATNGGFQWGSGDLGTPGTYFGIPQNTGLSIPSMQGFMLIAPKATGLTYTVTIPYNSTAATTKNTNPMRVQGSENSTVDGTETGVGGAQRELSYMSVDAVGKTEGGDRVWLFSQEGTSHAFDNGWDARKIDYSPSVNLHATEISGDYQVNTAENIDGTFLSFKAGNDTEYTLRIRKANLKGYSSLLLTDLVTGQVIDLSSSDDISYPFTAYNTATASKRFLLSGVKAVNGNGNNGKDAASAQFIKVFSAGKFIKIHNHTNENGTYRVSDMLGNLVLTGLFGADSMTELNSNLPEGVYTVQVRTAIINLTEKILIRK